MPLNQICYINFWVVPPTTCLVHRISLFKPARQTFALGLALFEAGPGENGWGKQQCLEQLPLWLGERSWWNVTWSPSTLPYPSSGLVRSTGSLISIACGSTDDSFSEQNEPFRSCKDLWTCLKLALIFKKRKNKTRFSFRHAQQLQNPVKHDVWYYSKNVLWSIAWIA